MFWNVAGLGAKDTEVWEYLDKFDFIGLTETWVDEAEWNKIKQNMPKGWKLECQCAIRENKKGRVMGGIITGIKQ